MTANLPANPHGRFSYGMTTEDWQRLASAYDTWNVYVENLECGCEEDEDVVAFVRDIFDAYGYWDTENDEPMLGAYRNLIMNLC